MEDSLLIEYNEIIEYCNSNKISVFWGDFHYEKLVVIDWDLERNNDWKQYIESIRPIIGDGPLILKTAKYDESTIFDRNQIEQQNDYELKTALETVIAQLKENIGKIYSLELSLIKDFTCYRFLKFSSWVDDVTHLIELTELLDEIDEEAGEIEENKTPKKKNLNKEEILEYVNRFLKEEDFLFLSSPNLRKNFIDSYYIDELHWENINEIILRAEIELDKYLRQRVKELKGEGKNGVQMMSILGLSRDRLRKYL